MQMVTWVLAHKDLWMIGLWADQSVKSSSAIVSRFYPSQHLWVFVVNQVQTTKGKKNLLFSCRSIFVRDHCPPSTSEIAFRHASARLSPPPNSSRTDVTKRDKDYHAKETEKQQAHCHHYSVPSTLNSCPPVPLSKPILFSAFITNHSSIDTTRNHYHLIKVVQILKQQTSHLSRSWQTMIHLDRAKIKQRSGERRAEWPSIIKHHETGRQTTPLTPCVSTWQVTRCALLHPA